jgi:hypothetical protein
MGGTSCCGARIVTTTHQPVSWHTCAGCRAFVTVQGTFIGYDTTSRHRDHREPDIGCRACAVRPWFSPGDGVCRCGELVEWITQRNRWFCHAGHTTP